MLLIHKQSLLFKKNLYTNKYSLHPNPNSRMVRRELTSDIPTRERLLLMLTLFILEGNFMKVLCLVTEFNLQFKNCTPSELKCIDNLMLGSKTSHPEFFDLYIGLSLYQENSGSLCFFNRIPFLLGNVGVERFFTSHSARKSARGYPDCIDSDLVTRHLQGWKLRNICGKQNLPVLRFDCKYDIITSKDNFSFYKNKYPNCRVRDHATFATYACDLMVESTTSKNDDEERAF